MDLTALFKLTYGIYVVSSTCNDKHNCCIVNSIFQVTAENPTIAISVAKANLTHDYIMDSRVFTISVLEKDTPLSVIGDFGFKSGKNTDKMEHVPCQKGLTGAPIVTRHTLAYIEAEVTQVVDVGTHTVFIGKIIAAENIRNGEVLTYAYYHTVKGGKSSKNAPTYAQQNAEKEQAATARNTSPSYVCKVCAYVYDPAAGDAAADIPPGTSFNDLPEDWVCPICGVDKSNFKPE